MTPDDLEKDRQMARLEAWIEAATEETRNKPGALRIGRCMTKNSIFLIWVKNGEVAHCGPSMHWN